MSTPALSGVALRLANRRGIAAISVSMAAFVANDALVKYASADLPTTQIIFIRGLFAVALLCALAVHLGAWRPAPGVDPSQVGWRALGRADVRIRALLDAVSTFLYLWSLAFLPLGDATAINMATPVFITLYAMLALGERVSLGRWVAIALGFVGVMLVVQPTGAGFKPEAWLCLGATLLHVARDVFTRRIPQGVPSVLITLATALGVTVLAVGLGALQTWPPVSAKQLATLAGASAFLCVGHYGLVMAMRQGEMSVVAPFRYVGLMFALGLGYAVWGEWPNNWAWAGIGLLVGAGLYILHGQRRPAHPELEPDHE